MCAASLQDCLVAGDGARIGRGKPRQPDLSEASAFPHAFSRPFGRTPTDITFDDCLWFFHGGIAFNAASTKSPTLVYDGADFLGRKGRRCSTVARSPSTLSETARPPGLTVRRFA